MAAFRVVVPARLRSTRLPGKMLADVGGRPLVAWAVERARASGAASTVVATDDASIESALAALGIETLMTSPAHETGTDRLAEAATRLGYADEEIVVNVQGDEPLIDPALIRAVAQALAEHPSASISTAGHPLVDAAQFFDPNVVKVVLDAGGGALYFSRAPVPFARDAFARSREALPAELPALRHIGIYAYRVSFLREFSSLVPTALERFEALEQLRALAHGRRIQVAVWNGPVQPGVDTPADLERVRAMLAGAGSVARGRPL